MKISIVKRILTNRGDNIGFNTIDTLANIVQILSHSTGRQSVSASELVSLFSSVASESTAIPNSDSILQLRHNPPLHSTL